MLTNKNCLWVHSICTLYLILSLKRETIQEIHKHIGWEDLNNGPFFILLFLCTISVKPKQKSSFPPCFNRVVLYACNTFIKWKLWIEEWFSICSVSCLFFCRGLKTFIYLYIYISLYMYIYKDAYRQVNGESNIVVSKLFFKTDSFLAAQIGLELKFLLP